MLAEIGNDIRIMQPNQSVRLYCQEKLTIDNPDYLNAKKMGRYLGNIEKKMKLYVVDGSTYVLPFGCLADIWHLLAGSPYKLNFHPFWGNSLQGNINLYDYQRRAVEALKRGKNGILEAPCGSGKTQMGLALIKELGGRALWLTHTRKLLEQSRERCEAYFKGDFGEITEGSVCMGKDITFATVQTMRNVDPEIYRNAFDIIVVDECHHCVGSPTRVMQFYKVLSNCNCRYKFGLSATLNRSDNLICSVFAIIGNVLHTISQSEVGDKIIKAEYVPVHIKLDYGYDYLDEDGTLNFISLINLLSNDTSRNKLIVDKIYEVYLVGKKQLVLCHRVSQVEELSKMVSKFCKVNCITGKVNQKKRDYDGDVIIATYSLAKEGLDIPTLDVLHLATPQKNRSTTEQAIGRIERNVEGKQKPICYDYIDDTIPYCVSCFKKRKSIIKNS